jgi:hypothetical protein
MKFIGIGSGGSATQKPTLDIMSLCKKYTGSPVRLFFKLILIPNSSIVDPDPVRSRPFWSDRDTDVWDRIRI